MDSMAMEITKLICEDGLFLLLSSQAPQLQAPRLPRTWGGVCEDIRLKPSKPQEKSVSTPSQDHPNHGKILWTPI